MHVTPGERHAFAIMLPMLLCGLILFRIAQTSLAVQSQTVELAYSTLLALCGVGILASRLWQTPQTHLPYRLASQLGLMLLALGIGLNVLLISAQHDLLPAAVEFVIPAALVLLSQLFARWANGRFAR
jgi:hypothetical protein